MNGPGAEANSALMVKHLSKIGAEKFCMTEQTHYLLEH